MKLEQGNLTIDEYVNKFQELCVFVLSLMADQPALCRKFEMGLNPYNSRMVVPHQINNFSLILDKALLIGRQAEKHWKAKDEAKEQKKNNQKSHKGSSSGTGKKPQGGGSSNYLRPRSQQFKQPDSQSSGSSSGSSGNPKVCYLCKQKGHIRPNCPLLTGAQPQPSESPQYTSVSSQSSYHYPQYQTGQGVPQTCSI